MTNQVIPAEAVCGMSDREDLIRRAMMAGLPDWDAETAVSAYLADPNGADAGRIESIIKATPPERDELIEALRAIYPADDDMYAEEAADWILRLGYQKTPTHNHKDMA